MAEQPSDSLLKAQIAKSGEDIDLNRAVAEEGTEQALEEERFDQADPVDDDEDGDPTIDIDPPDDEAHAEFDPLPPSSDV